VFTLPMERPFAVIGSFGTTSIITSAGVRRSGVMGAPYADTLQITPGGVPTWTVTTGALPRGITLAADGALAGFPQETGDYSFTANVVACGATSKPFSLSVTAPTLVTSDVVAQLLGPATPLTADQIRYLDFLGNSNGNLDIGDFLAWVKATGAPLSPAVLDAVQRKGKQR
jgi:Putative Ig domain